ncbi:MlaD family protein [Trichloromonas sp.]|uniref:MlaD family protein n=1 Tax=Trichloromonas sp. TaxID=3069249 RepID=UPI002A3E0726|nr:MlaD family protein [Trichloromonas sp.]
MNAKGNKAVIGAFVLGALALAVAGVILFGSGQFFTPQKKYVMYFDGSVKGLSVGAPVVFRGVKIGSVVDIVLQGDMDDMTFRVPVVAEVDLSRFQITNGASDSADYHQALIDRGLRAQLQTQSLVTGQLMVYFDFYPERPVRLLPDATGFAQVPTIPSTADELAQKLEELPLRELLERTNSLVGGLERLVNSPEIQEAPRQLNLTIAEARTLLHKIGREIERVSNDARGTITAATATIRHADRVLEFKEGAPAELVQSFDRTLEEVRGSLDKFDETLDAVAKAASDERSLYPLRAALKDLGEASRAFGALADYLDRHPEALLRGKTHVEEK